MVPAMVQDKTKRQISDTGTGNAAATAKPSGASDSHVQLSASDIRATAIGNTLVGTDNDREAFVLYLRRDGAALLRMENDRFESGEWELSDDGRIQSRFPTIAGGRPLICRYCRTGDRTYSSTDDSTKRSSKFTIEPEDSRGLDG